MQKREYQEKAIKAALKYFGDKNNTRGKLIMPCGTGKTHTAKTIAEKIKVKGTKHIVITVPNLILVQQLLADYQSLHSTFNFVCVCSDGDLKKTEGTYQSLSVKTNTQDIANILIANARKNVIVVATYQSYSMLAQACQLTKFNFDVGIIDEAHRTVGTEDKTFSQVLFDENIKIKKRLFCTATEKVYNGKKDDIFGMDNAAWYGETIYNYTLAEAIKDSDKNKDGICDYEICTLLATSNDVSQFIRSNNYLNYHNLKLTDAEKQRMICVLIAAIKAIQDLGLKKIVTYHSKIKKAQIFTRLFQQVMQHLKLPVAAYHVNGNQNTPERDNSIQQFKDAPIALLTNCQALVEGINIPPIDTIIFADTKDSTIAIMQAVGRSLRKFKGKQKSYIIVPALVQTEDNIEETEFAGLYSIVTNLGIYDEHAFNKSMGVISPSCKSIRYINNLDFDAPEIKLRISSLLLKSQLTVRNKTVEFLPMEEAMKWLQNDAFWKNVTTKEEWEKHSDRLPPFIPKNPYYTYGNNGEWKSWPYFLTGKIKVEFYSIKDALKWKQNDPFFKNVKTKREWNKNTYKLPVFIPKDPMGFFNKKGIKVTWAEWCGHPTKKLSWQEAQQHPKVQAIIKTFKGGDRWAHWRVANKENFESNLAKDPINHYKKYGVKITWDDWYGCKKLSWQEAQQHPKVQAIIKTFRGGSKQRHWKAANKDNFPHEIYKNHIEYYARCGIKITWDDWYGLPNKRAKTTAKNKNKKKP